MPILLHPNAPRELGQVDAGSLDLTTVTGEDGVPLEIERKRPTLVVVSIAPLAPGARATLHLKEYSGKLRHLPANANDPFAQAMSSMGSLTGSGSSDYGLLATGDGLLTFACAYPVLAPFRGGAFDTSPPAKLGDRVASSRFDVRTLVPTGVTLVTNLRGRPPARGVCGDHARRELRIVRARLRARRGARPRADEREGGRDHGDQRLRKRDADGGKRAQTAMSALASLSGASGRTLREPTSRRRPSWAAPAASGSTGWSSSRGCSTDRPRAPRAAPLMKLWDRSGRGWVRSTTPRRGARRRPPRASKAI
ncbi:MAG: hypothetical protein U0414_33430 [Polyangiaceae bacterium]